MPDRHFNAVIDMISEDGQTCTVTFDGYGTTEITRVADIMPRDWEAPMMPVQRERAKTSRYMINRSVLYIVVELYTKQ